MEGSVSEEPRDIVEDGYYRVAEAYSHLRGESVASYKMA